MKSGTSSLKKSKKHQSTAHLAKVSELVGQISDVINASGSSDNDSTDDIIVHVIDQGHGITRDFKCNKQKVMMKMRYF